MAASNVAWGIEIGSGAIKAIKLVRDGQGLTVADFAVIPHPKVLSTPDVDQNDAIRVALGALVNQHDLGKATIAISVPGHSAFARFAKLPPVEKKKVPDIVKFEAAQQIPFPIEEVEWDYQTFGGDPDIEVGIFAIKRERVLERLAICADVSLAPSVLTLSPVAAYNAVAYDHAFTDQTPGIVLLDIGTLASDLIVCEAGRVWMRTFPLGGHHFTEALVEAFKVPYAKAEKLKLQADQHEHKKHIFQAMKPVFGDLAQDVQRSLAYYRQLHPESTIQKMFGMGATFRLLGLRKFLSQQLQMDVLRYDKFARLTIDGARESDFQAASINLVTAYGLALQGLGLATIDANLIPMAIIRESVWKQKTPWIAAAAGLALLAGGVSFYRPLADRQRVEAAKGDPSVRAVADLKREGGTLIAAWKEIEKDAQLGAAAQNVRSLLDRRALMAFLVDDLGQMVASVEPQPELLNGDAASIPPAERRLLEVKEFNVTYVTPSGAQPQGPGASPTASGRNTRSPAASRGPSGGGSGPGLIAMPSGPSGPAGSRSRSRAPAQQDPEAVPSGPNFGAISITLVVDSTNAEKLDFVKRHAWDWLTKNADRPDRPYTFRLQDFDSAVKMSVVRADGARTTPAAGQGASARPGSGPPSPGSPPGARPGAGPAPATATGVDALAPLEPSTTALPPDTEIYRYVISWEAPLRALPGAAQPAGERVDE